MRIWRPDRSQEVAESFATAIFEALKASAVSKAVPVRGMQQILADLQVQVAAIAAGPHAPRQAAALVQSLARLQSALNAGAAEYEASFAGILDQQMRDLADRE